MNQKHNLIHINNILAKNNKNNSLNSGTELGLMDLTIL